MAEIDVTHTGGDEYAVVEREPREAILSRFEISVIGGYFPEYPEEIGRRLHR